MEKIFKFTILFDNSIDFAQLFSSKVISIKLIFVDHKGSMVWLLLLVSLRKTETCWSICWYFFFLFETNFLPVSSVRYRLNVFPFKSFFFHLFFPISFVKIFCYLVKAVRENKFKIIHQKISFILTQQKHPIVSWNVHTFEVHVLYYNEIVKSKGFIRFILFKL